ncbi:hypothetical protein BDV36DRAFT_125121 [Aspergillus pseudocaelatus]|uniref:Uncharacterized protein n=1 Tax=Aspergillus pseudocaelatus TaxID=1825620 RepID=A0ABQ6WS48_9EURO|nr:hypothetical protein BDV36DRAFT_125121 [Aspergillus pseudocaelatus]
MPCNIVWVADEYTHPWPVLHSSGDVIISSERSMLFDYSQNIRLPSQHQIKSAQLHQVISNFKAGINCQGGQCVPMPYPIYRQDDRHVKLVSFELHSTARPSW